VNLLSIGEFAHASRLSPKALRLYDESGLLVPEHVDPATGYRWYADAQLERARRVAALRRLGVPLAVIREILSLEPPAAAERIADYWDVAEAQHHARRTLAGLLVDELRKDPEADGRTRPRMYEVELRDMPERKELSLLRRLHSDELMTQSRELFLYPLRVAQVPRIEGAAGAAFVIFHGEVSGDSDGPVEWCRPLPAEQAEHYAAELPQFTLRTEPAHQEAFVRLGPMRLGEDGGVEGELALRAVQAWARDNGREPAGGIRMALLFNPANGGAGPDREFVVPLR
jgi:DNA-binding transcriptional MerR regulator